jgi:transcription elongation factor GreA
MMTMHKPIYMTPEGLRRLEEKLRYLRTEKRPEIVESLQDAKGNGDWVDNTEYLLLENELTILDAQIYQVEQMLRQAALIGPGNVDNIVDIGETVVIQIDDDVEKFTIVGIAETDPERGLISNESPLGRALVGRKVGDEIVFKAPDGEYHYRIIAIS